MHTVGQPKFLAGKIRYPAPTPSNTTLVGLACMTNSRPLSIYKMLHQGDILIYEPQTRNLERLNFDARELYVWYKVYIIISCAEIWQQWITAKTPKLQYANILKTFFFVNTSNCCDVSVQLRVELKVFMFMLTYKLHKIITLH